MIRWAIILLLGFVAVTNIVNINFSMVKAQGKTTAQDRAAIYDARMADWRSHQVVYQVLVDRFAYAGDPQKKAHLYAPPQRLQPWQSQPHTGTYNSEAKVWSHEIDFWGGDLAGLIDKLDYIKSLGVNVLYLNPIFEAFTNHKYDTVNYFKIDPQFGTEADFERLCVEAHKRGLHVVLDGVFNHTGQRSNWFQEAKQDSKSQYRNFYSFGSEYKNGYLGWLELENLPELNYNNPAVRDTIYRGTNSVVQHYLKYADGWRLDVAFELGPEILTELTTSAHRAKSDSYTVGEIYNYPAGWSPALDGVMNMYMSNLMVGLTKGTISGPKTSEMIANLIDDEGIEPLLKSWLVLSNHDRSRLKSTFPELKDRAFILALQSTLPGAPLVYYGEEIGLTGADDPEQRGPMNWEAALAGNLPETKLTKDLLAIHNNNRALQVGDFIRIPTEKLFAFTRRTDSVRDTIVVVANPTNEPVKELISPRDPWLMDNKQMRDLLSDNTIDISAGTITVNVAPKTVQIFKPVISNPPSYSPYKRVR